MFSTAQAKTISYQFRSSSAADFGRQSAATTALVRAKKKKNDSTSGRKKERTITRANVGRESSSAAASEKKFFVLRNCGDGDSEHLEGMSDIPVTLKLIGAKSVVGRVSSSAVNLAVGVATVSSAHAMIDVTNDGKVMVTDLTSTNGTYIDGEELLPGIPQELPLGGEVIFGDEHCARFELVMEEA